MSNPSTYRAYQVTGQRQFELVDRELVATGITPVFCTERYMTHARSGIGSTAGFRSAARKEVVEGLLPYRSVHMCHGWRCDVSGRD
jgi:hypothetical protein